jgi:hypothetical protein
MCKELVESISLHIEKCKERNNYGSIDVPAVKNEEERQVNLKMEEFKKSLIHLIEIILKSEIKILKSFYSPSPCGICYEGVD